MSEIYSVKLDKFEGPFPLLLDLIQKRKLFINEISLSQITDDYINFLSQEDNKKIKNIANFIIVASTLILTKSKSLMPGVFKLTDDEESEIKDLEKRLNLYKLITDIAKKLDEDFGVSEIFPRGDMKFEENVFSPDKRITKDEMHSLLRGVLSSLPEEKVEKPREVQVYKVKSLEEMIQDLGERIKRIQNVNFSEIFSQGDFKNDKEKKVTIVVGFLAMLELVRQGIVDAIQEEGKEEITISGTNHGA